MTRRKRVWYEAAGRSLDLGLVEQLRINRRVDPNETDNEIPVIVYLKNSCEKGLKDDLYNTCNVDSHNKLERELPIIHGIKGKLTPGMIKQIKDHDAVDRIFYDLGSNCFFRYCKQTNWSRKCSKSTSFHWKRSNDCNN